MSLPPPVPQSPTSERRRRLSDEERRDQIIGATVTVIARQGYDQASLARIADRAGVSKGLISHYFGDKDTLLEQTVEVLAGWIRDRTAAALDLTAPVPVVIRAALRQIAHANASYPEELKAVREIVTRLRRPDGSLRIDQSAYEESYLAQERLFRRGQAEGTLRAFDTRVMAATYQGAIDAMLGYLQAYPDTDLDAYVDALVDLILAAVIRR